MASPKDDVVPELGAAISRHTSPPGIRHRPLGRSATFADSAMALGRRRSSIFSETLSETRKSLRSSTDDLLMPRISRPEQAEPDELSHWHSLPLGLALLPAVGGLIFKDGSAVITDITLLALAAIFMNWALRMPWEWYRAAQSFSADDPGSPSSFTSIEGEEETPLTNDSPRLVDQKKTVSPIDSEAAAAQHELRLHELLALLSCFAFPLLAAWLLHAIRSQLSRPSEGLVSDYNLTIFLLVAEIRPLSHLIKMIQRRTLFLQRKVHIDSLQTGSRPDRGYLGDLATRVEELEARVADGITATEFSPNELPDMVIAKACAQATTDIKRSVQPELDALGRAMRRYEKRTTISAVQIDTRLQDLETRLKDVVVLAAAAQRNVEQQPRNYITTFTNWLCALVVVPTELMTELLKLPSRFLRKSLAMLSKFLPFMTKTKKHREGRSTRQGGKVSSQEREKRSKTSS